MATVAPSSDQAAELLQNLSLDAQPKSLEIPESTKKASVYQYGTVDSGISANGQIPQGDRPMTPFLHDLMDPSMLYQHYPSPYYYGGYTGTEGNWDDYSRYSAEGLDMTLGVYADNGSVMYGGYGYASYAPYSPAASPVPTMGNDGQLYGPQQYHYPPYFQPLTPSSVSRASNQQVSSQAELSIPAEQKTLSVKAAKANSAGAISGGVKGNNGSMPYKPKYRNTSLDYNNSYGRGNFSGGVTASGYQDSRYSFDGQYRSTSVNSFSKANNIPYSRNFNYRQNSSCMGLQQSAPISGIGLTHGLVNRVYPNKYYGNYGETFTSGIGYGSSGYDSRINARGWLPVDSKYKSKGRGNGYYGYRSETDFGLNEMNRGPRGKGCKYPKAYSPITLAVKGQNLQASETVDHEKDETLILPDMDQYNRTDFSEEYADAKFYIIKSYSEDDVHKSIKYNVWASTPTGNKKLDAAYQEAQQKPGGCPVFLLFSVNASGQFVGLAEMLGPVDFDMNVEYWQQDKWTGCFPVKWHIVKDISNSMLKHITLDNNENKPVTNSRDTQEVKLEQGLRIVKIFKDHVSKTCILDDFEFYEIRQKCIQSKKAKQQQFQKHALDAKTATDEKKSDVNGLLEALSDAPKERTPTAQSNGDLKHLEDLTAVKSGDSASKANKPVVFEKKIDANGIANA